MSTPRQSALRRRIEHFFSVPGEELGRGARFVRFQPRLWRLCAKRLWVDNLTAMASALSFRTIFAMVPALVLAFLVLKSLNVLEDGKKSLRKVLETSGFGQIALVGEDSATTGVSRSDAPARTPRIINVADQIEAAVDSVESKLTVGRLGPIGVVLLIWTALTLLTAMENSLNRIFGAPRGRSTVRRMLLYWSAMTLAPLVLVAAAFLGRQATHMLEHTTVISQVLGGIGWAGALLGGVALVAAVYKLLPNAQVPFRAAVSGAVVAVPLWLVAKWGFSLYVRRFVATGNLYGTLGVLPLFLIWLDYSWLIFLFGAELAHTATNLDRLEFAGDAQRLAVRPPDLLVAALAVNQQYRDGRGPVRLDDVKERLRLSAECVRLLLDRLSTLGILCPVETGSTTAYLPARPPDKVRVLDLLDITPAETHEAGTRYDAPLAAAVDRARRVLQSAAGTMTLAALIGDADHQKAQPANPPATPTASDDGNKPAPSETTTYTPPSPGA